MAARYLSRWSRRSRDARGGGPHLADAVTAGARISLFHEGARRGGSRRAPRSDTEQARPDATDPRRKQSSKRAACRYCLSVLGAAVKPWGPDRSPRGGAFAGLDRLVRYARAPMLISVRDGAVRRAGDMMVIGWFPLVKALRPLSLSRPSTRTWRQQYAGSWPRRSVVVGLWRVPQSRG